MNRPSFLFAFVISICALLLSSALCNCPIILAEDTSEEYSFNVSAGNDQVKTVNISGEVVDRRDYLVVAPFRANIANPANDQYLNAKFSEGRFNISIQIPTFAQENQTLIINITSEDGAIEYGSSQLVLTNVNSTSTYEIEILIANPPPNYSWIWIIIFVFTFGLILAGYAVFTRWMIGRMVLKKADRIQLDEWKRKGGGQMSP